MRARFSIGSDPLGILHIGSYLSSGSDPRARFQPFVAG